MRPVYSPLGRDTFALHESPGVHGRKSRLSSGKSYAHAGHQGNENGSYYVTEQREALDVIENSIPFNTRFIRPLSDGRGQGLPLLKLSASEKNVTSKLRYIRGTCELRLASLTFYVERASNALSRTTRAYTLLPNLAMTSMKIFNFVSCTTREFVLSAANFSASHSRLVRSILIPEFWPSSMEAQITN